MKEKTKWLEKYAPPGIGISAEIGWFLTGMIAATLHSLMFLLEYMQARNELYMRKTSGLVLMEGAIIRDFGNLTEGVFLTFYLVCIVTLLIGAYHYLYHYQGSKMMYLMRRLPDKWELHQRCLTLPVAGFCITIAWMTILKIIYYTIYILCTPSQCLPL